MTKRYHVYAIANALLDICYEVNDNILQKFNIDKGVMTLIDLERYQYLQSVLQGIKHQKVCGGSAVNTLVTLTDLGGNAFCSCKVANDEAGDFYLKNLHDHGVHSNLEHTPRETGITGKCIVMVTPDTQRTLNTFLGVSSDLSKTELMLEPLQYSDYLYIEGYLMSEENARYAAVNAINYARAHQTKAVLSLSDPNMVKFFFKELHTIVENGIDLIFCNEAEALLFCECNSLETAKQMLRNYTSHFVITLGKQGALVFDGQQFHEIPAYSIKAIDTVGAGDTFAGAYLFGLCSGYAPRIAADIANFAAAQVVSQIGPRLNHENITKVKEFIPIAYRNAKLRHKREML